MTFIRQKVAIHGGSDCKGCVIVLPSYQIDFEVEGSIIIVNKRQLHFLHKKSYNQMMCFIFDSFFY